MNTRVCGCVTGPPPNGVCNACGAVGPRTYDSEIGRYQFTPKPLTEEDVRRIIREELKRASPRRGDRQ